MPLLSNDKLKRDLRNARRVLWWKLVLLVFYSAIAGLGLSLPSYGVLLFGFSTLIILFTYILFLAFSRLAKHFHAMSLFWFFVIDFTLGMFFQFLDTIEKLTFYGTIDPHSNFIGGVAILTGAITTFLYGYFIMKLPSAKFGGILFKARAANIAQAFLMAFTVYFSVVTFATPLAAICSLLVGIGNVTMVIVTSAIDFIILGVALRLIGGVLPHTAPSPTK